MIDDSRKALRMAIAFCAGLFIVTCVFCVKAVFNLANVPASPPATKTTPVTARSSAPAYRKTVTVNSTSPGQRDTTPIHKPRPKVSNEFMTDYKEIRKLENAEKKQVENLRKYAQENPDAEDALTEEKIQEIEDKHLMVQ